VRIIARRIAYFKIGFLSRIHVPLALHCVRNCRGRKVRG
jgi:hypothetical protein